MKHLFLFLCLSATVCLSAQSQPDILINEVMANPKGLLLLPETEYVELYNTTEQPITLTDWWFIYDQTNVRLGELTLPAGGYVVLYRSNRAIEVAENGLRMPLDKFPYQLNNNGKRLQLYDASWVLHDEVYYPKALVAISWERYGEEWVSCMDERGGTPGAANSCGVPTGDTPETPEESEEPEEPSEEPAEEPDEPEEPDTPESPTLPDVPDTPEEPEEDPEATASYAADCLWINEVMADPKGLENLPQTEYVELVNRSDQPIELANWQFVYGDKPTVLTEYTLPAHSYVVLYRTGREIKVDAQGGELPLAKFPSALLNTGKELSLLDPTGQVIDQIAYEKAKPGVAWERSEQGFYLSTDPRGGTPGAANSPQTVTAPEEPDTPEDPDSPTEPDSSEEPDTPEEPKEPDTPEEADKPETPVQPYAKGVVWINEVMADPNGLERLPQTEYVELANRSDQPVPLKGWQFLYGDKPTVLPAFTLPAEGYVVLYRKGREMQVDEPGVALPLADFPSALLNTGKELSLIDPIGQVIDQLAYEKAKAGVAWERSEEGFYLSTDLRGGTPGSHNSLPSDTQTDASVTGPLVQPGEIILNELLPAPFAEGSEYIELYNRSQQALSLAGLALATRKADGSLSTVYPLSSITTPLESGAYALLSKSLSGVTEFYLISSPQALHELKLPVLANNGATLVLFRTKDLTVIDEVTYSPKWHDSVIKDPKGVALERIDPDRPTQEATNWHSAAASAGYGTPGYRNSQQMLSTISLHGFERPNWSESERSYLLRYQLAAAGYRCRIWVFDTMGRRVAEIANLTTLATEGTLRWDGLGQDGSRPRPGIYIFYAELYLPDGTTQRQREVFLVHSSNY